MIGAIGDNLEFKRFLPQCVSFIRSRMDSMMTVDVMKHSESPFGLLSAAHANEWWLLSNIFGWEPEQHEDGDTIRKHLRAVLTELVRA